MCRVWRGYDVTGIGGGEFALQLVSHQRVAPPYWRSDTHTHNQRENAKCIDYDNKVRDKVLVINEGILRKAESAYRKEPWTITTAHTNGTIRIQCGTKMERHSIQRVEPFTDDIL